MGDGGTGFFPGAGSFGGEFRSLVQELAPAAWCVRYPGRYGRDFGVPAACFEDVVLACAEQLAGRAAVRPVLFGHSYGAYVAYATAVRLQDSGAAPAALVVAGASAPALLTVSEQGVGTPSEAVSYLDSVDPGLLAEAPSQEWREIVVETVIEDLRLLRQFDPGSWGRLRCPIVAVRGQADPLTTQAAIEEWRHATDAGFSARTFPGSHSDFLRSAACLSWMREFEFAFE